MRGFQTVLLLIGVFIVCAWVVTKFDASFLASTAPKTPDPFWSMTRSEHLAAAKALIPADEKGKKPPALNPESLRDARRHLEAIHPDADEAAEAKKLLNVVNKKLAPIERQEGIKKREAYVTAKENFLLDNWYDAVLTLEGSDKTTLKIRHIFVSRPFVHNLSKKDDFRSELRSLGCKKVIATNGYDDTWTWDLK
jgi:hypothetical protein